MSKLLITILLIFGIYFVHGQGLQLELNPAKTQFKMVGTDNYKRVGLFGKNIDPIIRTDQEALIELRKFKTLKKAGWTTFGVALGAGLTVFIVDAAQSTNRESSFTFGPVTGLVTLFFTSVSGALVNFTTTQLSKKHIKRSVDIYNKNLL